MLFRSHTLLCTYVHICNSVCSLVHMYLCLYVRAHVHDMYMSFLCVHIGVTCMCWLPWWLSGKESTCNAEDAGSIPGLGRSPAVGNVNPLQYSYLGNPMERGDWWATVHVLRKSWTRLKQLSSSSSNIYTYYMYKIDQQQGYPCYAPMLQYSTGNYTQ